MIRMSCGIENTRGLDRRLEQAARRMSDESNGDGSPINASFRTRAIHVGNEIDPATGAVVPPIHMASTFRQPAPASGARSIIRDSGNPTRTNLQNTIASLEGGCGRFAFSSGMAAIHCVTMMLRSR